MYIKIFTKYWFKKSIRVKVKPFPQLHIIELDFKNELKPLNDDYLTM